MGPLPTLLLTLTLLKPAPVCYEIFVRSYFDSNGDGIGDLTGLTQKLDYIQRLGVNCLWLMPVAAAPSYHGYDATDYYRVEPDYGTNDDFKRFVGEAHRRGIRVLIDMVLNHESNEHPYFKDALLKLDSPYRSWFRWSPTDPAIKGPWGQPVWHRSPVREEYYYGIFWHGMPDLNYQTPAVREEAKRIARFWLIEMGVDGFRLDAVPYLVESGDSLAHTAGTHAMLREYAEYVRSVKPGAFTVGEVWDSIGSMLPYYPDQLDAYFAFALSDAILEAVRSGSAQSLLRDYLRLQRILPQERWAPFQRNHDQTRTMTVLAGDQARARLAVTLLLTLPGVPFIYYGEEIGMTGDKPDPRLRTPMHWNRTSTAGFTTARAAWEPLQPDSFTANVAVQDADSGSLLNHYRKLIHLRTANSALANGELVPLTTTSDAVVAFVRRESSRAMLVVGNLGSVPIAASAVTSLDSILRGRSGPPRMLAPREIYLLEIAPSSRGR
jgi:glycosidase